MPSAHRRPHAVDVGVVVERLEELADRLAALERRAGVPRSPAGGPEDEKDVSYDR